MMVLLLCACGERAQPEAQSSRFQCDSAASVGKLPDAIREASGVAIARRVPNTLWIINDDQPATLFAVDPTGTIKARVRVRGASNIDWEDIAIAPCEEGTCLFIADIGDNQQSRGDRAVYRVAEPLPSDRATKPATRYRFRLPGKSHDAESLFVTPDGRLFVITKGRSGPITVFEFPQPLRPDAEVVLEPIATLSAGLVQLPDMVTGASVTADGRQIVIRTYSALQVYTFLESGIVPAFDEPFDLQPLNEPQGEGVDVGDNGEIYLVSERGLADAAPISRLRCRLPD